MPDDFRLSAATIRKMRADHERLRNELHNHLRQQPTPTLPPTIQTVIVCKADSSIAAISGNTPGSGTASIWILRAGTWVDSGRNETVYNFSKAAVTAGEWLQAKLHGQSGCLLVDFESCS